ncbi:hypothetical protein [Lederbergia citrea]|uniref:hypothetical protein n=1 Tax=Lederbergia citrea TaxID=2833581 RepID=UPI001BC90109|nr:hypothetical protein [Lederbergia citrea]MBS4204035.1 hypothetical protein [Lederbergia citrea]
MPEIAEEDLRISVLNEIDQLLKVKNISDKEVDELSNKHFKRVMEKLTLQELAGLKRMIELQPVNKPDNPVKKKEEAIEAEFTEVREEPPVEPEKPSADDISFDDMQEEFPFD